MTNDDRPTVSRRNLVRALLGREIPKPRADAPAPDRHAAGDAAYAAGDYPAAVAAYRASVREDLSNRASVREDLSNTAVRFRLGHALHAMGQPLQARVEFEHVLRLSGGKDAAARFFLALSFLALGKAAKAATALAAFADPDRPELTRAAHEAALKLEADPAADAADMAQALQALATATALVPEAPTHA